MTIEEIAKKLDYCAVKSMSNCEGCKYKKFEDLVRCQAELIRDMANECRKIADQLGDDGK